MSATLSVRIDLETKRRLEALSRRSKQSASRLASQAISAFLDAEEWQVGEIQAGIADLDGGRHVSHAKVEGWLQTWGKPEETKAPR